MTRQVRSLQLAFAGLGVTAAAFPATIPLVAERAGVDPGRLLPAVPLLFGGLLAGMLATSLVPLRRTPTALTVGGLLQVVALVGFTLDPQPLPFLVMAAIAGVGFGVVEASGTVLARLLAAHDTTARLTGLTVLVALSAALTPLVIAVGRAPLWVVGTLALVPAAAALASLGPWPDGDADSAASSGARLPRVLVPAAAALFAYVGAEAVLSGWSSVLPQRLLGLSGSAAAVGTSAFWCLMGAGRLLAWALLRRGVAQRLVIRVFLGVAVGAVAGASLVPVESVAVGLLASACVGVAPSYAFLLGAALTRVSAQTAARATGPLVAAGSIGGTLIPAFLVAAGDRTVLACVALLLLVAAVIGTWRAGDRPGR